jgi:DivIVA domain-containing protein
MSEQKQHAEAAPSITPRTIREFTAPVVLRGYDRDSVDEFLQDVATLYEHALNDVVRLERRVIELETFPDQTLPAWADKDGGDGATSTEVLRRELQTYREREHAVAAALVIAQQAASELRSNAEKEAEAIRLAAATDVDGVRAAAQEEAHRIVLEARQQAQKVDEEASAEQSRLERELERLRSLTQATRQDLSEFLKQALSGLQDGDDDRAFSLGAPEAEEVERPAES